MVPSGSRGRRLALLGVVLAAAAAAAGPALSRAPEPPNREGGKLLVNVTGTDFNSLDPAVNYDTDGVQLLFATCARLFTYPDSSHLAGSMLDPEVSDGLPTVSADGRTYVFRIAPGFRFSNGAPVGAADVAYTIRRDLDPRMHSPSVPFLRDLVAYGADGDTLTLKLRHAAPDLLARLAMPFFCIVPAGTPIRPTDTIPSAGPYYVAARAPGVSVTVKRNPYYSGQRPNHLDEIDFSVFQNGVQSTRRIEAGQVDYDVHGVPLELRRAIAIRYGVNGSRFFAHPNAQTDWIVLNTSRPLFRDASVRRAVAYAVDRLALLHALGFMSGKVTTQILPPAVPGYRKFRAYPLKADVAAARKLMRGRHGTAVLYISDNPVDAAIADVLTRDLARIGIEVDRREFRTADFDVRIHRRSEPFDMTINGWAADYLDPYDFINIPLSGRNIPAVDNQNMSHFDDPLSNHRMDAAAALSGSRRYAAYAKLDALITRDEAPIVPYANEYRVEFVSGRVGCVVIAPGAGGLDYAAACLKR
jgi:ABC-type oligopeptide transport system substrate-binding subunit